MWVCVVHLGKRRLHAGAGLRQGESDEGGLWLCAIQKQQVAREEGAWWLMPGLLQSRQRATHKFR